MDTFITGAGALGLVKAVVDLLKYIRAKDHNGYITQLVVWLAGIGVVMLLKSSDFASTYEIGNVLLSDANTGTTVLAGLGLGSAAMLVNDFKKAVDRSDSAAKPDLVSPLESNSAKPPAH